MSNHLHIIMSDTFKGAGLMEGGPYWTIDYFLDRDLAAKVDIDTIVKGSLDKAQENQDMSLIDDLDNIKGAPVFILSGNLDTTCPPKF